MNQETIERDFVEAGWELDDGFAGHLAVGEKDHLSILAYPRAWENGDPAFELCDGEREVVYRVRTIPTPSQAASLLDEHGEPWDVEWDDPAPSTS